MHLDVAVDLLKKAEDSLCSYRHTGFVSVQISAKEICEEMNVVAVLNKKRLRSTKCEFSYEAFDEPLTDTMKKLEVSFFNAVVDVAVTSLREKTEMMCNVASKFSVLINFPGLSADDELEKQAKDLCNTLKCGDHTDLDFEELIIEMQSFPQWPKQKMTTFDLLVFLEEKCLIEIYPNMCMGGIENCSHRDPCDSGLCRKKLF
ncbi:hypothetical protein Pmani_027580 [Petrolisthes manimaculis]|uniref:Uncharacterized protein n=1 Tax=Petrolisthes manimaculis TaxID=1843537 RepID=A0AAE1P2D8_9EUCA|nr:hypothetical protein Pmani_027580 [Petrolisthes manimaculis]